MTEIKYSQTLRMSNQIGQRMLRLLAKEDHRTLGDEVAWLTQQELARRGLRMVTGTVEQEVIRLEAEEKK